MLNPIKYTTGSETLALKKGNFYIGTGDVGKGPSDTTGFYQGPNVPSGGYVIYMNREGAPGNLSYHTVTNDSELIAFTNNLAGQSYTTVQECLVYYAGQTDKVCLNRDYEGIVTDGLVLNLDAGFTPSYPKNGTTWYNLSFSGNNGTLVNGPTFSDDSIVFDGSDDYINLTGMYNLQMARWTKLSINSWFKLTSTSYCRCYLFDNRVDNDRDGSFPIFIDRISSTEGELNFYNGNDRILATINTNQIYNLQFTIDRTTSPNTLLFYLDNQLIQTLNINLIVGTNNSDVMYLGRAYPTSSYRWNGNIYNFTIYNKLLTPEEITQNYNAQKGRFGL